MLLLEELLEISSPEDENDDVVGNHDGTDVLENEDDGFDNFNVVKRSAMSKISAAECCANLERAAQNLVQLELEFFEGMDIPTIQVWLSWWRWDYLLYQYSLSHVALARREAVGSDRRNAFATFGD